MKTPRNPPLNPLPNAPTAARLTPLERNDVAGIELHLLDQPVSPFGRDVALAAVPGSVMMDNQLTDADAWRSQKTSGLMTVGHEQLRDESKQSKALDDDDDDDDDDKLPTTYQWRFHNNYNIGPPDAEYDIGSFSDEYAGYNEFRATAPSFLCNPVSFTEEEAKTYNKIVLETDGFGIIYVPPGVCTPGLLVPAKMEVVDEEGSPMLDDLAELAVVQYNNDNETSYQVVKIIRVNFRFDGWMFYNMTFQARDDKAGSPPRNFQARIRKFANETMVDFCRFEEENKPIQADVRSRSLGASGAAVAFVDLEQQWCLLNLSSSCLQLQQQ
ncbi:hypothetical protein RHGRI_015691 [Rhododendron griersonianum]|uniref:Cystatin domain-containing protein n=1 Tax=Rhododendron griersonianum TaxID=479676 RepID=A0AAV6KE89_9ERIC|nr:hypothetical protein RHGRI_015691 [Rhododendron griersonianum]